MTLSGGHVIIAQTEKHEVADIAIHHAMSNTVWMQLGISDQTADMP